jgi:hypothetical protein
MEEVEIEAFIADHPASKGITAQHIAAAVAAYDPDKARAPLVFGHPRNDGPAKGFISAARAEGSKLFVTLKNIATDAIESVRKGDFFNRSMSFWDPEHPSNPNPGVYSFRHIGLLGATAPAIPGMAPLKFSDDGLGLEFSVDPAPAEVLAQEPAPTPVVIVTDPAPQQEPKNMPLSEAEIAALQEKAARADTAEAEATRLREAEEKRVRDFAAAEETRRRTEDEAAVAQLVTDGKVLPAEADDVKTLFAALPTESLTFSTGAAEPRAALKTFLTGLPKRAPGAGKDPISPTGATDFSATDAAAAAEKARKDAEARQSAAWKPAGQ